MWQYSYTEIWKETGISLKQAIDRWENSYNFLQFFLNRDLI